MSLFKEWNKLTEEQTDATIKEFWKEYSDAESKIYAHILSHADKPMKGTIGQLAEQFKVRPVIFMGFLDGIQTSLNTPFDLEEMTEESEFALDIKFEKLLFNMHNAGADYLFGLDEWNNVFDEEKQEEIAAAYRRSKTVVREQPKVGRNEPCPCGSGKKYKHCCGRNA